MSYSQVNITSQYSEKKIREEIDLWSFECIGVSGIDLYGDITVLVVDSKGIPIYEVTKNKILIKPNLKLKGEEIFNSITTPVNPSSLINIDSISKNATSICVTITKTNSHFEIASGCFSIIDENKKGQSTDNTKKIHFTGNLSVYQYYDLTKKTTEGSFFLKNQFYGNASITLFGAPLNFSAYNAYPSEAFGIKPVYSCDFDVYAYSDMLQQKAEAKLQKTLSEKGYALDNIYSMLDEYDNLSTYIEGDILSKKDSLTSLLEEAKPELINVAKDSLNTQYNNQLNTLTGTYDSLNACYLDDLEYEERLDSITGLIEQADTKLTYIKDLKDQYSNADELIKRKEELYQKIYEDSTIATNLETIEQLREMKENPSAEAIKYFADSGFISKAEQIIGNINEASFGSTGLHIDEYLAEGISINGAYLDYNIKEHVALTAGFGYVVDDFNYFNNNNSFKNLNRIAIGGYTKHIGDQSEYSLFFLDGLNNDTAITYGENFHQNRVLLNRFKTSFADEFITLEAALALSYTRNNTIDNGTNQAEDDDWLTNTLVQGGSYLNNIYAGFGTRLKTEFNIAPYQTVIYVTDRFISRSYFTSGNPYLIGGLHSLEGGARKKFEKIKSDIDAGVILNSILPAFEDEEPYKYYQYKFLCNTELKKDLKATFSLYPNVIIVNNERLVVSNTMGTLSWSGKLFDLSNNTTGGYIHIGSRNSGNEPAGNFDQNTIFLNNSISLASFLQCGLNINYSSVKTDTAYYELSIGNFISGNIKQKVFASLNYSIPVNSNLNNSFSFQAMINYAFKTFSIGTEVMKMNYNMINYGADLNDDILWGSIFCNIKIN